MANFAGASRRARDSGLTLSRWLGERGSSSVISRANVENYRSGLIWRLMRNCPGLVNGLRRADGWGLGEGEPARQCHSPSRTSRGQPVLRPFLLFCASVTAAPHFPTSILKCKKRAGQSARLAFVWLATSQFNSSNTHADPSPSPSARSPPPSRVTPGTPCFPCRPCAPGNSGSWH